MCRGSLPCEWLRFIRELRYADRHKEVSRNLGLTTLEIRWRAHAAPTRPEDPVLYRPDVTMNGATFGVVGGIIPSAPSFQAELHVTPHDR